MERPIINDYKPNEINCGDDMAKWYIEFSREQEMYIDHLESKVKENELLHDINPRCFIVMERIGEDVEQLSVAFDTMEQAVKFKNGDYHKKNSPYSFIVCELNEG